MKDLLTKSTLNNISRMPARGDMWNIPGANQIRVFDGGDWITCNNPYDETSENYFRKKFEEERTTLHESHPELKELWEEYMIIRKLKVGT